MVSSKWLNKTNNNYKIIRLNDWSVTLGSMYWSGLPDTEDLVINHTESCSDARYYVDIMIAWAQFSKHSILV